MGKKETKTVTEQFYDKIMGRVRLAQSVQDNKDEHARPHFLKRIDKGNR